MHREIIREMKRELREKFQAREKELRENLLKEKRSFYEQEKVSYEAKCERIKNSLKSEFEKLLRVWLEFVF